MVKKRGIHWDCLVDANESDLFACLKQLNITLQLLDECSKSLEQKIRKSCIQGLCAIEYLKIKLKIGKIG